MCTTASTAAPPPGRPALLLDELTAAVAGSPAGPAATEDRVPEAAGLCYHLLASDFDGGYPCEHTDGRPRPAGSPAATAFSVLDRYVWSNGRPFALPARVGFKFVFTQPGELLPTFSLNRQRFGATDPEADGLSWYAGTDRHDFQFRLRVFAEMPP
jgi:hypothetical protein